MSKAKKNKSVSCTDEKEVNISLVSEEERGVEEDIMLSLVPYLKSFSIPGERKGSCCLILFDRAAKTWWNPKFDSEILEGQFWKSSLPQVRLRFQYALLYVLILSLSWLVYFLVVGTANVVPESLVCIFVSIIAIGFMFITKSHVFEKYHHSLSFIFSLILFCTTLCVYGIYTLESSVWYDVSAIGAFGLNMEVLLLIYTVIPMPLYACVLLGSMYSVTSEILFWYLISHSSVVLVLVRSFLHFCIHIIGIHILIMTEVRTRETFLKVGQSIMGRRELESEKHLKETMIHSVMPPKVADWLMSERMVDDAEDSDSTRDSGMFHRSSNPADIRSIFRPFNMNHMDNVSILFADIVGFTNMSSNKTAEQLVGLLNNLFGRFDKLSVQNGCEKISTLGDCYYCVSGCPEPRPDHATCCVEMGLGMIVAIREFDIDTNEDVNMRVGIHTGRVLCGIVGTKRFKFDVFSNDVSSANKMESTGKPGKVHISETTYEFLKQQYYVEKGENVDGFKTYFILGNMTEGSKSGIINEKDFLKMKRMASKATVDSDDGRIETHMADEVYSGVSDQSQIHNKPSKDMSKSANVSPVHRNNEKLMSRRHSKSEDIVSPSFKQSVPSANGVKTCDTNSKSNDDLVHHSLNDSNQVEEEGNRGDSENMSGEVRPPLKRGFSELQRLRKKSDLLLIKCVQQDTSHRDYFIRPPLSQLSLFFSDDGVEREYRKRVHRQTECEEGVPTLASPKFNTFFDILVSAIVFLVVGVSALILFRPSTHWLAFLLVSSCIQLGVLFLCVQQLLSKPSLAVLHQLYNWCTQWYPWHISGAVLVSLPTLLVYVNFSCDNLSRQVSSHTDVAPDAPEVYFYLFLVSLVHFCNFTQLNCWMKDVVVLLAGITMVILVSCHVCPDLVGALPQNVSAFTLVNETSNQLGEHQYLDNPFIKEFVLDVLLVLCLVWFLNREFEISYRLTFHGSLLASQEKVKVQSLKNQADWLLNNIIPEHVAGQIRGTGKYSENHKDVGVIFASIVNFNQLYDESYMGGREYLRVLNELISDFDDLLDRPEFRNVEKIKTIGSTFMAASGLNSRLRAQNSYLHQHLFDLLDFAFAMLEVVNNFNKDLIEFNFILQVGYNFGDVTAGVIGTTKLYYDIWGDAVNIASRMYSTGVPNRIQCSENCVSVLRNVYELEHRGMVYVKGKDDMNVYLVKGRKLDYSTPAAQDPV